MARARNLKPALFKNELLGVADPLLTLLFESLWCLADREGRLEDRPLRIKAETFPYREGINVDSMLDELQGMGFIHRYSGNGMQLIQIAKFKLHQTPHNTEKPSEYPAMLTEALSLNTESGTIFNPLTDSLNPPTDSLQPKRKRGDQYPPEFEETWDAYPSRPGANKQTAFKAWTAREREGESLEAILAGVRRYAAYVSALRTDPQYIKQPATFFGPDKHYKSDWTVPAQRASPPYQTANDRAKDLADRLTGNARNERTEHRIIDIN